MKNKENEKLIFMVENTEAELSEITEMLWYTYEDYYGIEEKDLYTKANYYDRLRTYIFNIHSLLYKLDKELQDNINKAYKN